MLTDTGELVLDLDTNALDDVLRANTAEKQDVRAADDTTGEDDLLVSVDGSQEEGHRTNECL